MREMLGGLGIAETGGEGGDLWREEGSMWNLYVFDILKWRVANF